MRIAPFIVLGMAFGTSFAALGCSTRGEADAASANLEGKDRESASAAAAPTPAAPLATATAAAGDSTPFAHGGAAFASPSPSAPSPARGVAVQGAAGGIIDAPTKAAELPRLDPNARYATTYRPGGAALAAFDAAVARGAIPTVDRDLVSDFGGRYAPAMSRPAKGAALAFQVDTERAALPPAGGDVDLRVAIRSSDVAPARAPLSVHLVLDVSGSMQGASIDDAKKAAEALVGKLSPSDDFSMVTFSSDAKVLVPDGPIGARRAQVISKIHDVVADGGTNIGAGLDLAYAQAHSPKIDGDAVKIVMLLSDGHANGGDASKDGLTRRAESAFQDGIQTSSFGLGADFDAALMSGIAERGAGGYYYLADATQITGALGRELDARLVPVAQAVEVRVRLRPDVVPVKVFGSHVLDGAEAAHVRTQEVIVDQQTQKRDGIARDRKDDTEGGMRFFIPAFAKDDRHAMLLTLRVPAGTSERALASVEVRFKDRLAKKNVTAEIPVKIRFAASDADSAKTIAASVAATAQAFAAGDTILDAASRVDAGDRGGAARELDERAEVLKRASETLGDARLHDDALRLARLGGAVNGDGKVEDPLPLAVMLRGAAYGYLK